MSQNREWTIDNVTYKYRAPGNDEIDGNFFYGGPPTACRAVRPQWLTMPVIADTYGTGIPKDGHVVTVKQKRPHDDEGHDPNLVHGRESTSAVTKHWYRRHLNSRYHLKFVGSLSKEVVSKFSEELSGLLCDDARHSNLDSMVTDPELNLVNVAAKQDAATISGKDERLAHEVDMQEHLTKVLGTQHRILEQILANRHARIRTRFGNAQPVLFGVKKVPNELRLSNASGYLLRTMAKPNTTPYIFPWS